MATVDVYERVDHDQNFPHDALIGCETALIFFAAGFGGDNDARWIREAGLRGWCVDNDEAKLERMREDFPDDWTFCLSDAYAWTGDGFGVWDVVTCDPYTNEFQKCADHLEAWCRLARHRVIIGTGHDTDVTAPAGWRILDMRRRSSYEGGVFWTVLERV